MANIKVARWSSLILGILAIALGILVILNPVEATISIVTMLGIILLVAGVIKIVQYVKTDIFHFGSFLVTAILDIILGLLVLWNVLDSTIAFTYLVGFWVIAQGITQIAGSIDLKRFGISTWWLGLIGGILGIVAGFILLVNPALSFVYVTTFVAIYLFYAAFFLISLFFTLGNFTKRR